MGMASTRLTGMADALAHGHGEARLEGMRSMRCRWAAPGTRRADRGAYWGATSVGVAKVPEVVVQGGPGKAQICGDLRNGTLHGEDSALVQRLEHL